MRGYMCVDFWNGISMRNEEEGMVVRHMFVEEILGLC